MKTTNEIRSEFEVIQYPAICDAYGVKKRVIWIGGEVIQPYHVNYCECDGKNTEETLLCLECLEAGIARLKQ